MYYPYFPTFPTALCMPMAKKAINYSFIHSLLLLSSAQSVSRVFNMWANVFPNMLSSEDPVIIRIVFISALVYWNNNCFTPCARVVTCVKNAIKELH